MCILVVHCFSFHLFLNLIFRTSTLTLPTTSTFSEETSTFVRHKNYKRASPFYPDWAMASEASEFHILLLPFLAQGHLISMFDMARLLANHGAIVTIVTTPVNAARLKTVLARAVQSGLQIRLVEIQFPWQEAGLPQGCENFDMLPSIDLASKFFNSHSMLQLPFENLFSEQTPKPSAA